MRRLPTRWACAQLLLLVLAGCCLTTVDQTATASGGGSTGGSSGTSSGTTSGASSSTGSGGTTGGACLKHQTSQQFDPCADAGECGCPYECVVDGLAFGAPNSDSQTMVCEAPCQSNDDCEFVYTACIRGVCALVSCEPDAGNGIDNSTCAMGSQPSSGTCFIGQLDGGLFAACEGGGTAAGSCLPFAEERSQLPEICPPGYSCLGDPLGDGGSCLQVCDNVTVYCLPHFACMLFEFNPPSGLCYPMGGG